MLRHSQRSILFPYTTLFRSVEQRDPDAADHRRPVHRGAQEAVPGVELRRQQVRLHAAEAGQDRDRKSTRLNSSHVEISYAVFCLKKKTIIYLKLSGIFMQSF